MENIYLKKLNKIKKYCNFKIDNHIIEIELYQNYLGICKIWYYYNNNFKSIDLYWSNEKNDFMYNYSNTFFTNRQKKILLKRIDKINSKIKDLKNAIHTAVI